MIGFFVIEQDLFTRLDVTLGEKEDVIVNDFDNAVRLARVVDVLRTVTGFTSIDCPIAIDPTNMDPTLSSQPARDFVT